MNTKTVYQRAIDAWGRTSQLDMAIEELSELIRAVCKIKRCGDQQPPRARIWDLTEEIADVEILIEQLKLMFDCRQMVREWKSDKLGMVEEMLKEEVLEEGEDK